MRNRDLRPAAKANPTIQQAFERFQKYNRLKNLSQGSPEFPRFVQLIAENTNTAVNEDRDADNL